MNVSAGTASPLILIVDDEQVNRLLLESILKKTGFQTLSVSSGEACLEAAKACGPSLILLDIMMPGLDGFSTCERLKSRQETRDIPVIFLSALKEVAQKTKGFASGGVDYVSKPFDAAELLARVNLHLTLHSQEIQLRQYAEKLENMVEDRTSELSEAKQELQRNYDMQTALNQLLQIALQDLPLPSLLQQCLESILSIPWLVLQNRGSIYLREKDGDIFHMAAQSNLPQGILEWCSTITSGMCACGRAIREESILLVRDEDLPSERARKIPRPHSHICVPIKSEVMLVALLNLHVENNHILTSQEKEFLQAAANTLMQMILYRQAEEKILYHLLHEPLTNLPNRAALLERLKTETHHLQVDPDYKFALILLNMDRFTSFNESFDYQLGDNLITSIASRLLDLCRPDEELLHLGGDSFAILLRNMKDLDGAMRVAGYALETVRQPYQIDGQLLQATASAGVVLSSVQFQKSDDILRYADTAVHQAKSRGRDRFEIFNQQMHWKARQVMQTFMDLRQAMDRKEFVLFYQPIVSIEHGRAIGVEALVRWMHPTRGLVSPGEFIPIAEETGLILPLGQWILEKACTDLENFTTRRGLDEKVMLSVNLSAKQFAQHDLFEQVEAILKRTHFPPLLLKLEITESVVMENAEVAVRILEKLKKLNVRVSIDDFGTGYSSLSYLHRFPVDVLKVDRSFVRQMHLRGDNLEIVRTIVTLAHTLSMEVVAEGAETEEEVAMLAELGCEYVQGYYFAKPMPLEELYESSLFLSSSPLR